MLKDLPKRGWSRIGTPTASTPATPTADRDAWLIEKETLSEKDERKHKERKRRRKKAEIYVRPSFHLIARIPAKDAVDHPARCGDHPTARVHMQARSIHDDVRRSVPPAAGADTGNGTRTGRQLIMHVPARHDAHLLRRRCNRNEQPEASPPGRRV